MFYEYLWFRNNTQIQIIRYEKMDRTAAIIIS